MVIHQLPSVAKGWNTHGMTQKQVDAYYMNTGDDCPGMNSQYAGYQAYKDRVDNRPRPVGYTSNAQDYKPLSANVSLQYANQGTTFFMLLLLFNGARWYLGNESQQSKSRINKYSTIEVEVMVIPIICFGCVQVLSDEIREPKRYL